MNYRTKSSFVLVVVVLILAGCSSETPIKNQVTETPILTIEQSLLQTKTSSPASTLFSSPTETTDIVVSITPTEEMATPTPQHTLTPAQSESSVFQSLLPAQYLVHVSSGIEGQYDITSIDGSFSGELNNFIYTSLIASFTWDGRLLVYSSPHDDENLQIYDWDTTSLTEVPTGMECIFPSWAPDKNRIATSCQGTLYIIEPFNPDAIPVQLWPPSSTESYVYAMRQKWSPDGQWLAFGQEVGIPGREHEEGIFVINPEACLAKPDRCTETALGPFFSEAVLGGMDFDLAWSPNSRYLAVISHRSAEIRIIDIEAETERVLVASYALGEIFGIAWSPDGEWLVFSKPNEIYIGLDIYKISPWGGEPALFIPKGWDIIDWFTIPHPANLGEKFVITEAGANLNLRVSPSVRSDSLMKLQPGNVVTVSGGLVEAEGYFWWSIAVDEETQGWAVNIPEWYVSEAQYGIPTPPPKLTEGIPVVNIATAEDARLAFETSSARWLNDLITPGRTFQALTLTEEEPLLLGSGWCASTIEILEQNDLAMEIRFVEGARIIDPVKYASRDYASDDPANPSFCRSYYILLDSWPNDLTCVDVQYHIHEPITDGWNEYDPGIMTYLYCVSLKSP